jgi:hypothetical protein
MVAPAMSLELHGCGIRAVSSRRAVVREEEMVP